MSIQEPGQYDRVLTEHFETKGIDVGRHKNDELAQSIAYLINKDKRSPEIAARSFDLAASRSIVEGAMHELQRDLDDRSIVIAKDPAYTDEVFRPLDWSEIDKSPYADAYDKRAAKIENEYDDLARRAAQIAYDMSEKNSNDSAHSI